MSKIYIGADPGKEGAMFILYPDGDYSKHLYPKVGNEYDLDALEKLFSAISEFPLKHLILENVHSMPGIGASANWSLSRGKTIIELNCRFFKIPHTLVHPKTWQKEMHQGIKPQKKSNGKKDTKATSLLAAQSLFPHIDLRRSERAKNAHDGIFDALLMAEYGRRKNL